MNNSQVSKNLVTLAEDEHAARGKLAAAVRAALLAKQWAAVAEAYGQLEQDYGKRHSLGKVENGRPVYSPSTPADSMRATIHNVSSSLRSDSWHYNALKPVIVQDSDGNEVWGLAEKSSNNNEQRAGQVKSLTKSLEKAASLCKTDSERKDALAAFAKALGLTV